MENIKSAYKKLKPKFSFPGFTSIRRLSGNILIISSLFLFLAIYLPVIRAYVPFSLSPRITNSNSTIKIPKINAHAPLIDQVDPWDKDEYTKALKKGVAISKGFAKPGENGTIFIFAHSSDSPWRITSYNTVFFRLGELKEGDEIEIKYLGGQFNYKVSHSIEVWPNEVEAVTKAAGNRLILQTCTPVGTSLKRLLVFARPADSPN